MSKEGTSGKLQVVIRRKLAHDKCPFGTLWSCGGVWRWPQKASKARQKAKRIIVAKRGCFGHSRGLSDVAWILCPDNGGFFLEAASYIHEFDMRLCRNKQGKKGPNAPLTPRILMHGRRKVLDLIPLPPGDKNHRLLDSNLQYVKSHATRGSMKGGSQSTILQKEVEVNIRPPIDRVDLEASAALSPVVWKRCTGKTNYLTKSFPTWCRKRLRHHDEKDSVLLTRKRLARLRRSLRFEASGHDDIFRGSGTQSTGGDIRRELREKWGLVAVLDERNDESACKMNDD
ncbi:hypothetical protein BDN71DRAFT_1432225 [Pleurotus eryngii]|uniref:Uncharacterized protein n=1 Tax=Pleurotus eryngii TaxID=5323 RepID=A0A9P6DE81_PLEER|nr:hypothetical protein BDN71DRAFT_1432225 [Pleurotus eryngii]